MTPRPRRTLAVVLVAFAATMVALAAAPSFVWFVILTVPLGFASASFQSVDTVVLQQATEPSMQGRVMALHQLAWFGSTPIGALAMGAVIDATSPRVPFLLGALAAGSCAVALVGLPRLPGASTKVSRRQSRKAWVGLGSDSG